MQKVIAHVEKLIAAMEKAFPQKLADKIYKFLKAEVDNKMKNEVPANIMGEIQRGLQKVLDNEMDGAFEVELGRNTYAHYEENEPNEKQYEVLIKSDDFKEQLIIIGFKFIGEDDSWEARIGSYYVKDTQPNFNKRLVF